MHDQISNRQVLHSINDSKANRSPRQDLIERDGCHFFDLVCVQNQFKSHWIFFDYSKSKNLIVKIKSVPEMNKSSVTGARPIPALAYKTGQHPNDVP